jgi:membrane-associated phospholipid phosphatase
MTEGGHTAAPRPLPGSLSRPVAGALLVLLLACPAPLRAQDPPQPGADTPSVPAIVGGAVLEEAKRYARDGAALVTSPLRWDGRDWVTFGAFAASLGVLLATDQQTYVAIQERRSPTTDDISDVTTPFGQPYAWAISGAMLAGGLITKNPELRDTGRDALEAAVFASLLTAIFKPLFGRERPYQSDGRTVFHGFTTQYTSFPSGHATMAWAVASVVAMRTDGWVVPTIAYTLATMVSFDRVNDQKHFVADVFTGAAIGVSVGRFVVGRHRETQESKAGVTVSVVPVPGGMGARIAF